MTNVVDLISLVGFTVALAAGQLLFKRVGLAIHGRAPFDALATIMRQPQFYAALTIYGFSTFLWIWILSRVPLTRAYPWVAAGMAIVPLLGWLVFGERVGAAFWLGLGLILAGILVTQYATTSY